MKEHKYEQRAFEGASGLVAAKYRSPFRTQDGKAILNVECFGSDPQGGEDDSEWPKLLFVHGVCESAETWTVQRLAVAARKNRWRLVVLELEGHGLSSGPRAVCGDFSRLCRHVTEFIKHVVPSEDVGVPFALCGSSLGGVLSAYGADFVVKSKDTHFDGDAFKRFVGAALISPAVGVAPEAVPPAPIVGALRVMSMMAPSAGFLTPVEDPTHYNCPETSKRNFSGNWPLSTSRMLLDITSKTVRKDQAAGRLALDVPSLLVIAGERDEIVPIDTAREFLSNAKSKDQSFLAVPRADHGLMFEPANAGLVTGHLFHWLKERVGKME